MLNETSIQERLKEAMRARASEEVMVLRGIVAAIKNLKIERRSGSEARELTDADITQLVRREIKQRDEAISFAEQGGRRELVEKNTREKQFLESFLPKALSSAELGAAIEHHHAAGATSVGALMGKLKSEFGARLDGKIAAEAVKEFLRRKEAS